MTIQSTISSAQRLWNDRKMMKVRKVIRRIGGLLIRGVFLLGFSFIILYSIISMISRVFMQQGDLFDNTVVWIPKHFTLDNLRFAIEAMKYSTTLPNTVIVSVLCTLFQTVMCMLVGYGFARFEFPLKKLFFALVILTILIPPQALMIPMFLQFRNFDVFGLITLFYGQPVPLLETHWPYLLLSLGCQGIRNGLFIFMFRQSFRGMPKETEEAARVDGAGVLRTFAQIMVPNAITIITTVALFGFVWQWNDSFYTGLFSSGGSMLSTAYESFTQNLALLADSAEDTGLGSMLYDLSNTRVVSLLKNSAVFLVMTPLMLVYALAQRAFVESVERSGLVG